MASIQSGQISVSGGTFLGTNDAANPGSATLNIDGGVFNTSSLTARASSTINHTDGTLTINGGTFDDGGGNLIVSSSTGNPVMRFVNGASATQATLRTGQANGESGEVEIGGNGTLVNVDVDVFVGRHVGGSGALTVTNNGQLDVADDFLIGFEGGRGVATVDQGGVVNVADIVQVGRLDGAASTLTVTSGGVLNAEHDFLAAVGLNSEGHVTVTGAGSRLSIGATSGEGDLILGRDAGTATLTIADGADVSVANIAILGRAPGSTGTVTMTGGTLTTGTNVAAADPDLEIGVSGSGVFTQSGGSVEVADVIVLAEQSSGVGAYTLTGGTAHAQAVVSGFRGRGDVTIGGTGVMSTTNDYTVASLVGSTGSTTVESTGQLQVGGDLFVSAFGNGTFAVSDSGVTEVSGAISVGLHAGATGAVAVDGGTLRILNTDQDAFVGNSGSGTFEIKNGGLVDLNDDLEIGLSSGSLGEVTVGGATGATATLDVRDGVGVGVRGDGSIAVLAGGIVTGNNTNLGQIAGSSGSLLVDGAGAQVSLGRLNVGGTFLAAGGEGVVMVNEGDLSVTNPITIWAGGGVELTGGRLTAASIDHSHGGVFTFTGGELNVDTFDGTLTQDGGLVTIGDSPGVTTVAGDYDQNAGVLEIELAGAAIAGVDYDLLAVTGDAMFNGVIDVNLDGFTPSNGDVFQIVTAASYAGSPTFDFVDADLSSFGLFWDTSEFLANGTINVIPEPSSLLLIAVSGAFALLRTSWRRV